MEKLFFRSVSEYAYYNQISRPTVIKMLEKGILIKHKIGEKEFILKPIDIVKYFAQKM